MNEQEIFIKAMSHRNPGDRSRFLDEACQNDPSLRDRIQRLFQHGEQAESFFEDSPAQLWNATEIPARDAGVSPSNAEWDLK